MIDKDGLEMRSLVNLCDTGVAVNTRRIFPRVCDIRARWTDILGDFEVSLRLAASADTLGLSWNSGDVSSTVD